MSHSVVENLIDRYPVLQTCREDINSAFELLKQCFQEKHRLYLCGNGGSAADAEHIAGELMKSFLRKRYISSDSRNKLQQFGDRGVYIAEKLQEALPAISLCGQVALPSAILNDTAGDMVYAQPLYGLIEPGDVLLGISTSGNSANIVNAAITTKILGGRILSMTGQTGGELKGLSDVCICAPSTETYLIQEMHLPIYHALCIMLEDFFFS